MNSYPIILLFLLFSLLPCSLPSSPFNFYAYSAYQYSLISFCPPQIISEWSCGRLCSSVPPLAGTLSFSGPNSSFFYLSHEGTTNRTYLIFRGTDFASSSLDLQQSDAGLPYTRNCSDNCRALSRPYLQMQGLKEMVYKALDYYWNVSNASGINSLIVAGKGLGGSIAQLIALEMINDGVYDRVLKELYTFGAPAIGNFEFYNESKQRIRNWGNFYRVTYYKDPCPFFPEGFQQWDDEIFYNSNNKIIYCQNFNNGTQDPRCSNQFRKEGDLEDHFKFFNEDSGEMLSDCLKSHNNNSIFINNIETNASFY